MGHGEGKGGDGAWPGHMAVMYQAGGEAKKSSVDQDVRHLAFEPWRRVSTSSVITRKRRRM
jgi:hypothetical protein